MIKIKPSTFIFYSLGFLILTSCGTSKSGELKNQKLKLEEIYSLILEWQPMSTVFNPPLVIQDNFEKVKKQSKDTAIYISDILILKQHYFNLKTFGQSYGLLSENNTINEITSYSIKSCPGKLKLTKQDVGSGFLIYCKYKSINFNKNLMIEEILKEISVIEGELEKSPY